jgi:hypothetical protein
MKRKRLYLIALICYAAASGIAMIRLFDSVQQNNKPNIMGAIIWIFFSIIAFISFLLLYRKQTKNNSDKQL